MPYSSVNELPKNVKSYEPKVMRQWMHVFNSTFKKTGSEQRAFMAANSILKKRFKTKDSMSNNTRNDYFSMLVDSFLGNLKG